MYIISYIFMRGDFMPSMYAHYRFGARMLDSLPQDLQRDIRHMRRLYNAGAQGPDFFYYYNPLFHTAVGDLGGAFHDQSGRDFFTAAAAALKQAPSEGGRAYLYGLLAHYALDSACHPFVHEQTDSGEISHSELEVEFDRYLLELDGQTEPCLYDSSRNLKLTRGECDTAALFYPGVKPAAVRAAFRRMALLTRMLAMRNRKLLTWLAERAGSTARNMVMHEQSNGHCAFLNTPMLERYEEAEGRFIRLAPQLAAYLEQGEELGEDWQPTFG